MDVVLTDDEIAAVALHRHLAWPLPFPTVATDIDHLAAAAARGRRSLLVRGLATPTDSGVEVAADIVGTLEQAASARCVMAWVASVDDPAVLAGSSTVIHRRGGDDVIDLTSAIGIHDFRDIPAADATAIVVALVKNVFDFGFAGPTMPTIRLFVGEVGGDQVLVVSAGKLESGEWGPVGVVIHDEATTWESALVEQALQ